MTAEESADAQELRLIRDDALTKSIEARLARLPLKRAGFEERARKIDWVFLGLWPIGDDLTPVVQQRAADIAFLVRRWQQPCVMTKPSEAAADVERKFRDFAEAWQNLPEGCRPTLNWRALALGRRSALKAARLWASTTTKHEVAHMVAVAYYELTGEEPSRHSSYDTPFSRLVRDIFELGGLGYYFSVAGKAARRFNNEYTA